MSRLDDVKDALVALTQGLTEGEKMWAIKKAFPSEINDLVWDKVAEELKKQRVQNVNDFEDNDSNVTVDNSKEKYNIKYDDNIVEIVTGQNIEVQMDSSVECGYVGAGGMSFTYDNPEETTIRLIF